MFTKSIVVLALSTLTFATPQNFGGPTSELGIAIPTNIGDIDSELAFFSDVPTLPASVYSILETAIPDDQASETSYDCNPTAAPWFSALPNDAKSALTSYVAAYQTWGAAHSSQLEALGAYPSRLSACNVSGGGAAVTTGSGTSGTVARTTSTGAVLTTGTGTGSGVSRSASGSATGSGSAAGASVTSTRSGGAAPRATGAIVGSVAGVVGALGVMALL